MTKIECPICFDNDADCWWTSDSDGASYTWITWYHACLHCGYSVKKLKQYMYDFEDVDACQLPGHREMADGDGARTIDHALNTNINFGGEYPTEVLKNEIARLKLLVSQLEHLHKRSLDRGGVFVSYSHDDRESVNRIVERFDSDGINYWLDEKDILVGQSIDKAISDGIQRNWLFLVVLSPVSISSKWVERELDEASYEEADGKKVVLPVVVAGLAPSMVPPRLRRKLYADMSLDFDAGYAKLKKAIITYLKSAPDR